MKNKKLTPKQELYQYIDKLVYEYPTKHKEGFIALEEKDIVEKVKAKYPELPFNENKFSDALCGITCMMDEETNGLIIYHCDIKTAILCGIEDRGMYLHEWD